MTSGHPNSTLRGKDHISILDFLRGLAALAIVLLHFSNGGLPTIKTDFTASLFSYGLHGVHVFFIISGFVIPLALYRSGYSIGNYFNHIGRRFLRIDPPAYLSLVLVFALYYGAIYIKGEPIEGMFWPGTDPLVLISNLLYIVPYTNSEWYNPVFWTLTIEFQFYLLIGLIFPLLMRKPAVASTVLLSGILILFYLPVYSFFDYGSLFVTGMVLFMKKVNLLDGKKTWVWLVIALGSVYLHLGTAVFIFALITTFCILFLNFSNVVTDHLGKISFSLYLTHLFTGWTAEILVSKFVFTPDQDYQKFLMLLFYVALAIVFSSAFYRYVEKPFISISRKYKTRQNISSSESVRAVTQNSF